MTSRRRKSGFLDEVPTAFGGAGEATRQALPAHGEHRPMALSLNKPKLDNLADEIWKSAERLRGKFKPYEYQNVVLPIIVIRRLECVLIKWREDKAAEVLSKRPKLSAKELAKLVKGLETSTAPFSNKTNWTLRLVYDEDHTVLEENFRDYIKLYPKGVVSKALQNVAFQDDGLIQYKAEVMLRIFEEDVKPLIGGRAKAMIVATSRVAEE
jgi:type I restriction-modification system DNA methylase subunit